MHSASEVVMVPCTTGIAYQQLSIYYTSAMCNPLHSSTNQELFKKCLYNQSSCYENTGGVCYIYQLSSEIESIHYTSLSACTYVQPATQQYESRIVQKHLCNQSSHSENMDDFPLHKGSHHVLATTKVDTFPCQQR